MSCQGELGQSLLGHEVTLLALGISLFGEINSLFVLVGNLLSNALIYRNFCWSKTLNSRPKHDNSL
jgi:hypothetical protein